MTLPEKEAALIERYLLIDDRHERLNALVGHRASVSELEAAERLPAWLVEGCTSRVWLKLEAVEGTLQIRFAADSVLVRGLVALLVELYQGASLLEIRNFSPRLLPALGLDRMLSPTRLHGLAQVFRAFQHAA